MGTLYWWFTFASIYEVLDLNVQLYDAKEQIESLKNLYNSANSQVESYKEQLASKIQTEVKDKIENLKNVYEPKSLYKNMSFGSLLLALTSQVGVVKQFLVGTLGFSNQYVLVCTIFLSCLFLFKYLYNVLLFSLIEELIGYFTNPNTIKYLDNGKYLNFKSDSKIHIFEETDFFDAVDKRIESSKLTGILLYGHVEKIKRQIVDTVITDLLGKKIISISYVYEGVRTFKIEESDYVTHMDKGF